MYQKVLKWFSVCLVVTAFSLATCVNTTAKATPDQIKLKDNKESRDVETIDMTSLMNDCNETFRTEMSYVESLNQSGSFPDETDKTAKCFVRCLLEKTGVVSEAGEIDRGRAPAFFAAQRADTSETHFRNSTDACSDRNETCACERSYQFVKCVVQMELKNYDIQKNVY